MTQGPEQPDAPENSTPVLRTVLRILFVLLGILSALPFLGLILGITVQIPYLLVTGWLSFLSRTIPRISWNWDLVGMALLSFAGLLGLTHGFLKWLTEQIAVSRGKAWSWPWRCTWCGALSIGVLFLVGMAAGGIVHQAGWIASSPESLYETKGRMGHVVELKQFHLDLIMAMNDCNHDLEESRRELKATQQRQRDRSNRSLNAERFTCLAIVDPSRRIVGAILFHRVRSHPGSSRDIFYWNGSREEWISMGELPELIRKHQGQLVAM